MYSGGSPAIEPRTSATPAFSEQDVRDYLSQSVPLHKIISRVTPTVAQVVLTTIGDLGLASGDDAFAANYPADQAICYVDLHGAFQVIGPRHRHVAPARDGQPASRSTAFIVFDAHSGSVLVNGTPACATWT